MENINKVLTYLYLNFNKVVISLILSSFIIFVSSCDKDNKEEEIIQDANASRPTVLDKGLRIKFPENSSGIKLIKVEEAKLGTAVISVIAPARVVATISNSVSSKDNIIMFDTPDVTSLYSQYRQTKANIVLYTKNLSRIKEMYENQGATARDMNQAENDLNLSKTFLTEMEGRLRSMGFNPVELDNASSSKVILISDVPEGKLKEVQNGEDVPIVFNSFPEVTLHGNVSSIGDVVDPVTRTVKVRISLKNYKNKLIPGMYCKVDFGDDMNKVVSLPPDAVVSVDGKDYIFIEETKGVFLRKTVSTEHSTTKRIIVTKGINEGDLVVIDGAMLLKGLSFGY